MSTETPNAVGVKKPFPLRKFTLIASVCAAVGYTFVFVAPRYQFAGYFQFLGDTLSFLGLGMLIAALVVYVRRPQYSQFFNKNVSSAYSTMRGGYKVIVLGIIALIISRIVQAFFWPPPSILNSSANAPLVQNIVDSIIGGIVWGFLIGWYFVGYSNRVHLRNPVYRAIIVSFLAVLLVTGLSTLLYLNDAVSFFLWGLAYSIPSYFVLGTVLGYSYKRLNSDRTILALQGQPVKRSVKMYYVLAVLAIIAVIVAANFYQGSRVPVSFTANNFLFSNNVSTISLQFIVTNPSSPALIQINAYLETMDMGECNPGPGLVGLQTNQTATCVITNPDPKPVTCSNLPVLAVYGLELNAYFGNSKTVNNYYNVTRQQIGCK